MTRRELMKWFGAGAAVVPIINGMPKAEAEALIVTPPEIEVPAPVEVFAPPGGFLSMSPLDVTVFLRDRESNRTYRFSSEAYMESWSIDMHRGVVDMTTAGDTSRRYLPSPIVDCTLKLRGVPQLLTR